MAVRVAYTLEQCWHQVPGGTASAALAVGRELLDDRDVELVGVAGRHRHPPAPQYRPPMPVRALPVARPWLYELWLVAGWPKVEGATGPVDVAHATGLVPCASIAPMVVTVHDLAFLHHPQHFSRHGARMMRRSLEVIRRRAGLVLCSSMATLGDCAGAGVAADRLRHVPLGTNAAPADPSRLERLRLEHRLPETFALFVGTLEPRKNLHRLAAAVSRIEGLPLVVAGAEGWGDAAPRASERVRFLGFVPSADLAALYAAASVFAYPSEMEGFGLPVLEAMAQGTPVVTSAGTSTEEVAGGSAVLVDPFDVDSIEHGLRRAMDRAPELDRLGRARAATMTWAATAAATKAAYVDAVSGAP